MAGLEEELRRPDGSGQIGDGAIAREFGACVAIDLDECPPEFVEATDLSGCSVEDDAPAVVEVVDEFGDQWIEN